jgi:hypothetical protein
MKNLVHHSWFYRTADLGFPFGQQLYDYRSFSGDSFNLLIAKVLGLGTTDPAALTNLFIVVSYPLVGVSGYVGARLVGLRRAASVLAAVVFATLPFHQSRIEMHLFYANYSAIPLAIALAIRQAGPKPMIRRIAGKPLLGVMHRDVLVSAVIIIVVATSGSYFGAFSCLFLAFSIGLSLLRRRHAATLGAVVAIVAIGVVMTLQTLPFMVYQRAHGENNITVRSLAEFDIYPLRPAQLILPVFDHRLPFVRSWRDDLPLVQPTEGSHEALGLFGALGFLGCCFIVVWQFVRMRRPRWSRRLADAPLMLLAAASISIFSGLDWLVGVFGFTEVRAWNRISVFVAFLCVSMAALAIDQFLRRRRSWVAFVLLPLVLVTALLDQSTRADVPPYAAQATEWGRQGDFVAGIEKLLGPKAAVFELPIIDYPENPPVVNLPDYGQMFGYLHSDTLRWSYGGVKGRTANWRRALDPLGPIFVDDMLITGFTGVTVNLAAYEDKGAAVLAAMRAAGFSPALTNRSMGGVVFFDLRSGRAVLDQRVSPDQQAAERNRLLGKSN